ncbi:cell wall-binding protein EntB [Bacillus thuringiensis]|uniref:cell wall-binding protein EntB n=1 Tax=Bacillus thuringiensis TaxID=1428 RepID=UPI000BF4DC08|nr:cell wall-binding protein EntB [Bacillus thuringiensis]PFJ61423.1 enterotoxin [Bacillus thuringiensis]PFT99616.1 enterotoxin [Bacillus thuringiensis]PFW06385.1 enterotoxin [Bacillus thuringiensis]PGP27801.1 enterotoxin [Bacillus thuringiensis]
MKKVIGAATATIFGLGAFTTTATAETIVTADVLNVREKPTTESKVVEKVKNGQELKVINTEDGWSKIELNGKEVFVSSEFTKDVYHVTANLLNVRTEANTDSEILGRLKKDDVIESTHQVKDGWLQFEYKGKTAYANVSFLSSTAPTEKKTEEKAKQVTKVQKSVKEKKEVKTQKVAKVKETTKAQEIVKPKEEVKVKEEPKAQEIVKPKEEAKVKEEVKVKEEPKAQEMVKPKEEAKVKEEVKVKEEPKAQEIVKPKEEAKVKEEVKAKEEEKVQEIAKAKEEKAQEIAKAKEEERAKEVSKNNIQSAKRELTVVATAYTADPSENGTYGGRVLTAMGHDLTANPNMRIIAVDPKVIPLGSKVWVEGYGEAIAGDTGSAIKGNRIDVLMGSKSKAMNWGRKTVKVKIL